jgi:hypothetical protein
LFRQPGKEATQADDAAVHRGDGLPPKCPASPM